MDGVALCDLLVLRDVPGRHQDRALVDAAPQGIRVAAVVDQGQAGVDGAAHFLPGEGLGDLVHGLRVVNLGAHDLVDQTEDERLQRSQRFLLPSSSSLCWFCCPTKEADCFEKSQKEHRQNRVLHEHMLVKVVHMSHQICQRPVIFTVVSSAGKRKLGFVQLEEFFNFLLVLGEILYRLLCDRPERHEEAEDLGLLVLEQLVQLQLTLELVKAGDGR